jgi:serine/threonine protein kinase, bacterial
VDEVAFGRFRLLALIGEGGMGKVYKAHDTVIGRDVAIKVLPTELGDQPGYRERFRREAHTAARLTEPHIIPIHDAGENDDGQLYLVMPLIDGIDVHSLLKRDGPMSPQRAVAVVEQLAAALDAAHEAGLVHRDIKPSNALVTRHDFVYLIDFGIAHDATAYMAPERFTTGTADARADIYALAGVFYECLTGVTPFSGDSIEQQIAGHLTLDPPKPASLRPAIAAGFDEVIATGMAKNRRPPRPHPGAHANPHPGHRPHPACTDPACAAVGAPAARRPAPRRDPTRSIWLVAGTVYVADAGNNRVVQLPPGSSTPTVLPLTGLNNPVAVAVDAAGTVYVADAGNNRVVDLPAGSSTPTVLPFTGLTEPVDVQVNRAGNVYVCDYGNNRVVELPAGSGSQTVLPFTGLNKPAGSAVDAAGSVYVADAGNRVVKSTAG